MVLNSCIVLCKLVIVCRAYICGGPPTEPLYVCDLVESCSVCIGFKFYVVLPGTLDFEKIVLDFMQKLQSKRCPWKTHWWNPKSLPYPERK